MFSLWLNRGWWRRAHCPATVSHRDHPANIRWPPHHLPDRHQLQLIPSLSSCHASPTPESEERAEEQLQQLKRKSHHWQGEKPVREECKLNSFRHSHLVLISTTITILPEWHTFTSVQLENQEFNWRKKKKNTRYFLSCCTPSFWPLTSRLAFPSASSPAKLVRCPIACTVPQSALHAFILPIALQGGQKSDTKQVKSIVLGLCIQYTVHSVLTVYTLCLRLITSEPKH